MKRLLLAYYTLIIALTASATDFIEEIRWRSLPVNRLSTLYVADDPSVRLYRDSLSLSRFNGYIADSKADETGTPQDGTGRFALGLEAESHMRLDEVSAVWGNASFSTGSYRDVKWCNVLDYSLTGPYVLGDGTGGKLSFRRYDFGGGYTRRLAPRWTVGAHLGYRAEIGWRSVDPRIRTVVSDLQAKVGASYAIGRGRHIGLTGGVRSYSQQCDLEFYNPLNDINTYPLTGLGTYYKRFAGNTNKNSGHTGFGYSGSLRLVSADGSGLQTVVGFSSIRINLYLRNFNNICPAFTDTRTVNLYATYGFRFGSSVRFQPALKADISRREGTENIFGTAAGASYDKIGSRPGYSHDFSAVALSLPVQMAFGNGYLTIMPAARFDASEEKLKSDDRSIRLISATPGLHADYSLTTSHSWLWNVSAGFESRRPLTSELHFPGLDRKDPLQASVADAFAVDSTSTSEISVRVSASRSIGRIVAMLSVEFASTSFESHGNARHIISTISITF